MRTDGEQEDAPMPDADQAYTYGYEAWRPDQPPPPCPYAGELAVAWWRGWEEAEADSRRVAEG